MNKNHFYIVPLLLLAGACASDSTYRAYGERPTVDDKTLVSVPVDDRDDINKARAMHAECVDKVTLAKSEIERAEERKQLAIKEVDVAEKEMEAAKERYELARKGNEADRDDRIEAASERRDAVHAHLEWSRAQVRLEEGRIEKSKAQLAVAERHVDLANAKVELAKAKAVADLKRSDYDSIVVSDFERYVADEELDVKLAEIDAEACDKKIELRQDYLDERAKAVPASYREDWHKNEAPAAAPKK